MGRWLSAIVMALTALLAGQAGYGNETARYLSGEPVSMLTFGMYRLNDHIVENRGGFHPDWGDDDVLASAHFVPSSNTIWIQINRRGELADEDAFGRACDAALARMRTQGGYNIEEGQLHAHLEYSYYARFFEQAAQRDKRLIGVDDMIMVQVTANLPGLRQGVCSGPLLGEGYRTEIRP